MKENKSNITIIIILASLLALSFFFNVIFYSISLNSSYPECEQDLEECIGIANNSINSVTKWCELNNDCIEVLNTCSGIVNDFDLTKEKIIILDKINCKFDGE